MNKGQIFSTDFLIAMVLIILGLGVITSVLEFNQYNIKQKAEYDLIKEKTQSAMIALTNNPSLECDINGILLPYSINTNKFSETPLPELKDKLGLRDYNIQVTFTEVLSEDQINSKTIISLDLNILACDNTAGFSDLNNCMKTTDCAKENFKIKNINLRVGN